MKDSIPVTMLTDWVRFHSAPKLCRGVVYSVMSKKQKYYHDRSYERYLLTADGVYLSHGIKNMEPEIGRIESVRFVTDS